MFAEGFRRAGTNYGNRSRNSLRMKTLLIVFTLSGLTALSTNIIKEYHYVETLKTWAEAQSYCREAFNDLAAVRNKDENNRLLSVLQGRGKYAWIGLYDDLTKWKWSLENTTFNYVKDFSNWKSREPDNENSTESCIVMSTGGYWSDISCLEEHPAVCYNEQGPSKYVKATKMTWLEARRYCRSMYTDLVRVTNVSENEAIASLSNRTWIGLFRNPWFYWSDRSRCTLKNWEEGQPDNSGSTMKSCAVVNTTTGKWWDIDCDSKHHFVCQKFLVPQKHLLKLKFQSEADLNDPAIQQQLLEQLHAKLEKHGIPDFKLHWIQTDGKTFHKGQKKKKEGLFS